MVAEAKDQTAGTSQDAYVLVRSRMESFAAESKVLSLNGNGYNLKVRKPYTIRKQRERWTEEEHQKFIEALKLYGRAWPQIEEHVGTKTAIQIRSHAQKFFAKVSRDFSTDVDGSSTPVEIPPPRPKKKPVHPYPRKIVDSSKTEDIDSHQQETSNSPDVSVAERANCSPTSVLSNVAEMHKSRLSPTSCATDECSADLLFTENDREWMTFIISNKQKDYSHSPVGSSVSALNDKSSITDQTAGTSHDAYVLVRSQKSSLAAESKDISLNGNGYNLRIRKPYTIRKQRERWTEEEHQKFVEALKLHGRAWRQIEEHVGTKTAIQIRSHAQKFFAKVCREFNTDVGGSSTPVEIPPPRPKKKPLHPYPRKIVDSSKTEDVDSYQQETTNSSGFLVAERENLSPASVLSNVAGMHNSRLSPTLCAADLLFTQNDREYMTSNISDAEKDGSRSLMGSSASALKDKSITKFELFSRETEYLAGSPNAAEPFPSIKLFGKTVVERDTMKLYIDVEENSQPLPPNVSNNSESNNDNLVQNFASNYSHPQVEFGSVSECATPYSLSQILLHHAYCHMENIITLPWSTWYQGVAYPYPSYCKITAPQNVADFPHKALKGEEIQHGSSKNQSNPYNSGKGFVPYKRCSAERDDKLSMSCLQEQEGQKDRVCS